MDSLEDADLDELEAQEIELKLRLLRIQKRRRLQAGLQTGQEKTHIRSRDGSSSSSIKPVVHRPASEREATTPTSSVPHTFSEQNENGELTSRSSREETEDNNEPSRGEKRGFVVPKGPTPTQTFNPQLQLSAEPLQKGDNAMPNIKNPTDLPELMHDPSLNDTLHSNSNTIGRHEFESPVEGDSGPKTGMQLDEIEYSGGNDLSSGSAGNGAIRYDVTDAGPSTGMKFRYRRSTINQTQSTTSQTSSFSPYHSAPNDTDYGLGYPTNDPSVAHQGPHVGSSELNMLINDHNDGGHHVAQSSSSFGPGMSFAGAVLPGVDHVAEFQSSTPGASLVAHEPGAAHSSLSSNSNASKIYKSRNDPHSPFSSLLSKLGARNRVSAILRNAPGSKEQEQHPEASHQSRESTDSEIGEDSCYCGRGMVGRDKCYFCWPCDGQVYCDTCWNFVPPHQTSRKQAKAARGTAKTVIHEKSEPHSARKIVEALHSDNSLEQQELLHQNDEDTAWFGTGRQPDTGDTVFQDFGRYSRLMNEAPSDNGAPKYPALVSFVGQTGAGKSSLIRLLVELHSPAESSPQVPVVGSSRRPDLPTSGDVHLYADLKNFSSSSPILYADCEGLDGGEREPSGARLGQSANQGDSAATKDIRRQHYTSERQILWATDTTKKSREYHVRHLYPRLLYTFSDVIVFVIKNHKVIESVIEQLLRWAADALETSSNQPVLPHAIIVLNAYDNASNPELWDPYNATMNLMERVSRTVYQNHKIKGFAEFWRQKGRRIEFVESLLLSYYSSITVVHIPERGRPNLINQQVQRLHAEISKACESSRASKHRLRMLLNSDELQPYLQCAFDHFSRNLEEPFDFVKASLSHNPITSDFAGNLLKLAIDVAYGWKHRVNGAHLFQELVWMAASCVMVECARRRTLGPAGKMLGAYIHHWDTALRDFCDRHWPCEYIHIDTRGRCVNVKSGHTKGHQLHNGKVLSVGDYQSSFVFEDNQEAFHFGVLHVLEGLLQRLSKATFDAPQLELEKAHEIHRTLILNPFFKHLGGAQNFVSHTACYSCLMTPPEHPLPCGHVLCTPCARAYGQQRGRTVWEISRCPQHDDDVAGQFSTNWPIYIKPPGAGVRIVSLDGGGVRGLVQLYILRELERQIGPGLPIQLFIDLIVGTGSGGVIALGLGANGWTIQKCIRTFERLCDQGFTKRKGIGIPGIEHFISMANNFSRYESRSYEYALKAAFGEDQSLFAGPKEDLQDQSILQRITKVAVVTTTLAGVPAALGNYNRVEDLDTISYQFHRSDKPKNEIKMWEAARATSATPSLFRPFLHKASGQTYEDGCLYHNNPIRVAVREQRLLWPDRADTCPDIVLSIGTGTNSRLVRKTTLKRTRFHLVTTHQNLASMATDHIQSSLHAEQTWNDFLVDSSPSWHLRGFERLNIQMDDVPPKMDDVTKIKDLRDLILLRFAQSRDHLKDVADRLLATSFYFSLIPEDTITRNGETRVYGTIQCRLPAGAQTRALGEALEMRVRRAYNQEYTEHRPYFIIQERRRESEAVKMVLTREMTDRMMQDGFFAMGKLEIKVSEHNAETDILFCFADRPDTTVVYFPISGFPRCLVAEADKILRPRFVQQSELLNYVKVNWDTFEAAKAAEKTQERLSPDKDLLDRFGKIGGGFVDMTNIGRSRPTASSNHLGKERFTRAAQQSAMQAELPVVHQDNELFMNNDALKGPVTDHETMRLQWLRMYTNQKPGDNLVTGPPGPHSQSLYRDRPSLYPPEIVDQLRWKMEQDRSGDPKYTPGDRSALSKTIRPSPSLPSEPFELM